MKTIEIKVYSFDELSDEAKKFALDKYLEDESFDWIWHDACNTIKAFVDKQSIVETSRESWLIPRFSVDYDELLELSGIRLMKYFHNNYDFLFKRRYRKHFDGHKNHRNIVNKIAPSTGNKYCFYYSSIFIDDNCCPLTGVCYDDDFLRPIYEFLKSPDNRNFRDIIEQCFKSLEKAINNEIEGNSTIESFSEHCDANDYQFLENGKRYF